MKFLNKITVLLLFVALFFTACQKENIDEIIPEDPAFQPEIVEVNTLVKALRITSDNELALNCVSLNYPLDVALESGDRKTISSKEDYEALIGGQSADQVVDFVFPLSLTLADGSTSEVASSKSLGVEFASCIPTSGWESLNATGETLPAFLFENSCCFDLVYPVNLEDGDGNVYTAASEAELIALMAIIDPLSFSLPMTVALYDGSELVINTADEFFDALFDCEGIAPPVVGNGIEVRGFGCNQLVFPFNVVTPNGVVTVIDENQYAALILSGVEMVLEYPFSLIDPDDNVMVINDFDDLIVSYAACGVIIQIDTTNVCDFSSHILLIFNQGAVQCGYNVNFPIQVEAEGVIYDINNMDDYLVVYNMYSTAVDQIQLLFPVDVTLISDGSTLTFDSDADVCAFIDGC